MMTNRNFFFRTLSFLLPLFQALFLNYATHADFDDAREVRLGVLAYSDFSKDLGLLKAVVNDLNKSPQKLHVKYTLGTYADLKHWMREKLIDVALVSPGIAADLVQPNSGWEYIASDTHLDALPSVKSSICLSPENSSLKSYDDLSAAINSQTLKLFLVDPDSVGGAIAPLYALRNLKLSSDMIRFTHSHSNALRISLADESHQALVCVWKTAWEQSAQRAKFKEVEIPELPSLLVPRSMLLARADFSLKSEFQSTLLALRPKDFAIESDWQASLQKVLEWKAANRSVLTKISPELVSIDDLVASLMHFKMSELKAPRLAVVLAGGGAKCSFQVGALRALEEMLESARAQYGDQDLAVKLVVGTSGGAINALATALGLPLSEQGQKSFEQAWHRLDQRQIFSPSWAVRVNFIVWLFAVESLLLVFLAELFGIEPEDRHGIPRISSIVLGLLQILLICLVKDPWSLLGNSPLLHKVWLWFSFGALQAGVLLVFVGSFTTASVWLKRVSVLRLIPTRKSTAVILLFFVAALPALQAWNMLWREETLSQGDGISRAMADNFESLVRGEIVRRRLPDLSIPTTASDQERLRLLSRAIFDQKLLVKDLVLTASPLYEPNLKLPGDFYFYVQNGNAPADSRDATPRYAERGVDLTERSSQLLEVVMGSGAIYPVFPSRRLTDFPHPGEGVDLVDGSFAHRSPLEAAVQWGATHVVLIEASTDELTPRGSFVSNISAALNYLYDEAQLTDLRSRGQVTIYSLIPRAPHIGLLDFAENLISHGIRKGYSEARGEMPGSIGGVATWKKELGRPVFY